MNRVQPECLHPKLMKVLISLFIEQGTLILVRSTMSPLVDPWTLIVMSYFVAAAMSLKKKHVINEVLDDECCVGANQQLVKVLAPCGNYLYEVCTTGGETFLASMPSKFRNTVWIRKGSFVIIESIDEGQKVRGEIVKVLLKHHLKQLKKEGSWPKEFDEDANPPESSATDDVESEEDSS